MPRTWSPATPTTPSTSSCSTDRPAPPSASRWPATARNRTAAALALILRFRRMAALWPTAAMPQTWSLAIPTAPGTSSCSTGRPIPPRASPSPAMALKRTGAFGSLSPRFRRTAALSPTASDATNLVPGDTNDSADIFVFDRQTNTTTARVRRQRRHRRQRRQRRARDFGGWPLCDLLQRCLEPCPRRHQRHRGHLPVRPADQHHYARLVASDGPER